MARLMTLNLNFDGDKHGPWDARKRLIVSVLESSRPDLASFQAVRKEGDRDQARELADEMSGGDRHAHFQPSRADPEGRADGLAFLSRAPLDRTDFLPLSRDPGGEDPNDRVLLHALFELNGDPVNVFNAHFSWVESQAARNVGESVEFMSRFQGGKILMGDFNCVPQSAKSIARSASSPPSQSRFSNPPACKKGTRGPASPANRAPRAGGSLP